MGAKSSLYDRSKSYQDGFNGIPFDSKIHDQDEHYQGAEARLVGVHGHSLDQPKQLDINYLAIKNTKNQNDYLDLFGMGKDRGVGSFTGQNFSDSTSKTKTQMEYQSNFTLVSDILNKEEGQNLSLSSQNYSRFPKVKKVINIGDSENLFDVNYTVGTGKNKEAKKINTKQASDLLFDAEVRSKRDFHRKDGNIYLSDSENDSEDEDERLDKMSTQTKKEELAYTEGILKKTFRKRKLINKNLKKLKRKRSPTYVPKTSKRFKTGKTTLEIDPKFNEGWISAKKDTIKNAIEQGLPLKTIALIVAMPLEFVQAVQKEMS